MNRLERIQRISGALRYLLLACAALLGGALMLTVVAPAQQWISLGDGQLNELRSSGVIGLWAMFAIVTPIGLILCLGVYWLQRLFAEYQQGHFFTDANMRCYLWLVWLKAAAFAYSILWPLLSMALIPGLKSIDLAITIEPGALVELAVLLVIVHLLKEAQQIHDENKTFI